VRLSFRMGGVLAWDTGHKSEPVVKATRSISIRIRVRNLTNYVVVLPDGRAFYSDAHGNIVATPVEANKQVGLAVIGGLIGLAVGSGPGAILGALLGAAAGNILKKRGA
jgi:hypothetical protein